MHLNIFSNHGGKMDSLLSSRTSSLRLTRMSTFMLWSSPFQIHLDGRKIGIIFNGGMRILEVQPGHHNLFLKIAFPWTFFPTSSLTLSFDITLGEQVKFLCKMQGLFLIELWKQREE
jgi:hypothetical protein